MITLIGSQAALKRGVHLRKSDLKDVDYFVTSPEELGQAKSIQSSVLVEAFYHPALAEWDWSDIATIDELYTIKMSHSYWSLKNKSWNKHTYDMAMLKREGATLIPELHDILYKVWEELHGKKQANLEQTPDEFFNSNIHRKYEHDSIHASVAYFDGVPLFNRILRDNHAIAVDKSKFDALTHDTKLKLVREEVYATALERRVIPSDFDINPDIAYSYALMKTITSFTKGWFPMFILDNYEELRTKAEDYVSVFHANSDRLVEL